MNREYFTEMERQAALLGVPLSRYYKAHFEVSKELAGGAQPHWKDVLVRVIEQAKADQFELNT